MYINPHLYKAALKTVANSAQDEADMDTEATEEEKQQFLENIGQTVGSVFLETHPQIKSAQLKVLLDASK